MARNCASNSAADSATEEPHDGEPGAYLMPPNSVSIKGAEGSLSSPAVIRRPAGPMPLRKPESELRKPESELRKPESELRKPESELRKPESELRKPESELRKPESELRKPESELRKP